jgi:hypothetical protein
LPAPGNASPTHLTGQAHGPSVLTAEMLVVGKEVPVLSDYEQRVWDDIERFRPEDVEEPDLSMLHLPQPSRQPSWDPADLPAWVVAGAWLTVLVMVLGGPVASFGVGMAAALAWALWHWRWRGRRGRLSRTGTGTGTRPAVPRPDLSRVG